MAFPIGTLSGATSLDPVDLPEGMWTRRHTRRCTYISSPTGSQTDVFFSNGQRPMPELRVDWWQSEHRDTRDAMWPWIIEAVNGVRSLPAGWDGRHARPVTEAAVLATLKIAFQLVGSQDLLPQIFPLPDGGLQLEWHVFGAGLEIEVDGSGAPFAVATDAVGQTLWEREFAIDDVSSVADLRNLVARMAHGLESAR